MEGNLKSARVGKAIRNLVNKFAAKVIIEGMEDEICRIFCSPNGEWPLSPVPTFPDPSVTISYFGNSAFEHSEDGTMLAPNYTFESSEWALDLSVTLFPWAQSIEWTFDLRGSKKAFESFVCKAYLCSAPDGKFRLVDFDKLEAIMAIEPEQG